MPDPGDYTGYRAETQSWQLRDLQEVVDAGGSGAVLQSAPVTLDNDQIKALRTTYIEVVPAPGEDKIILFVAAFGVFNFAAGGYTGVDADAYLEIVVGDWAQDASSPIQFSGNASIHSGSFAPSAFRNGNDLYNDSLNTATADLSTVTNQPLKLAANNDADFVDGHADNTLTVTVLYAVIDV